VYIKQQEKTATTIKYDRKIEMRI